MKNKYNEQQLTTETIIDEQQHTIENTMLTNSSIWVKTHDVLPTTYN